MAHMAKDPLRDHVILVDPMLRDWYDARSWRLSREWLAAHLSEAPRDAAQMLQHESARLRGEGHAESADEVDLHARLLAEARAKGVDPAYRAIIGDQAFHEAGEDDPAEMRRQIQEWLSTPNWGYSRAYLGSHPLLLTRHAELMLTVAQQQHPDAEARKDIADHLKLLRYVKQLGIFEGYQRFVMENFGS